MHFRIARTHAFLQHYGGVVTVTAAILMCVNVHTAPISVIQML